MKETTYFPEVSCAVMDGGILPEGVTACITDMKQRRQYVQVTRSMINHEGGKDYLPVGIVDIDRRSRRVLIELPTEADSGANRMWVTFEALRTESSQEAGVVA